MFILEICAIVIEVLFIIYAIRVYVNSMMYGRIRKWIAVVYAVIVTLGTILIISGVLTRTHWCTAEEEGAGDLWCMGIIAFGLPFFAAPGFMAFGFLFLLIERAVMANKYGRSKYVLQPQLHPAYAAKYQQVQPGRPQTAADPEDNRVQEL